MLDAPKTIEDVDRRLELCRASLREMRVRSSKEIVWLEIDALLELRVRLKRRMRKAVAFADSP